MTVKFTKSDHAYRLLKKHLETGTFKQGERLTEAKVSKVIGMGRGPVRESMLRLEAEGLLKSRGSYGSRFVEYVESHSRKELIWRYELRAEIDGLAARLAAENMTGKQIAKLRNLDQQIAEAIQAVDRERRGEASRLFHDYLLINCGNPLLHRITDAFDLNPVIGRDPKLDDVLLSSVFVSDNQVGSWLTPAVEAIASHQPQKAEQEIQTWIKKFIEALRDSEESDTSMTASP